MDNRIRTSYELPLALLNGSIPGDIGFCIGNYVLEYPPYAEAYVTLLDRGVPVILDNGLHETGEALDFASIVKAIRILGPRPHLYVIAPDKLHDGPWTYKASTDFKEALSYLNCSFACVAQGDCLTTSYTFYRLILQGKWGMVCLPFKADRPEFLRTYPLINDLPHHLLGSYGLEEIHWLRRYVCLPQWTSIDTSKPVKAGALMMPLAQYRRGQGLWKVDSPLTREQIAYIEHEVAAFDEACHCPLDKLPWTPYSYHKP